MPTKNPKAHYEYLSIYNRHVVYGNDFETIRDLLATYFEGKNLDVSELDDEEGYSGLFLPITASDSPEIISVFVMYVADDASLGTVAHEATHLTNGIFLYLGQELDAINDEAQAYLVGHLVDSFLVNVRDLPPPEGEGAIIPKDKNKKKK